MRRMPTQRKADLGMKRNRFLRIMYGYLDSDKSYLFPNFSVTQARKASFLFKPVQSVFLL